LDPKRRHSNDHTVAIPTNHENSNHRNIFNQITSLYGRETLDEIRVLEKLRVKIKKRLTDLEFLKDCRDKNVLPKFAQIQHRNRNKWNSAAFAKLGLSIVKGEIKRNRYNLDRLSRNALRLHLKIAQTITPELWKKVDAIAAMKAEKSYLESHTRHASKLRRLITKENNNTNNNTNTKTETVVSLSARVLNEAELSVLEKGLNFAISPTSVPIDNIICCMEDIIQHLADEDKKLIRQDCSVILCKAKPPKSNLSKEECTSLKDLRNDENLVILRVDKGGTTILMNLNDYNRKMNEHLYQSGNYRKLNWNPIKKIIRQVKNAINNSNLDERTKKCLTPNNEITQRICILLKIHKEDIPLKPIVNTIGYQLMR